MYLLLNFNKKTQLFIVDFTFVLIKIISFFIIFLITYNKNAILIGLYNFISKLFFYYH